MEIISATALISINETFFIQLISFLVFVFLLNRIMIRPLSGTMSERKHYLETIQTDIDKAAAELDVLHRDLDEERTAVLKEAGDIVHALDEEAEKSASELIGSAQQRIVQLRNETEAQVAQQVKAVRDQLSGEVDTLTTMIMEKVLHRRLQ